MSSAKTLTTRLAPSPTGALHLGNARTFLINWVIARQRGWRVALRMDDLDSPRVKQGADRGALADLEWLGLNWDEGPVYQTELLDDYLVAVRKLARDGWLYPCRCTRSQIEAAQQSAPHAGEHDLRYPGTCRPIGSWQGEFPGWGPSEFCWRIRAPEEPIEFIDEFLGPQTVCINEEVGDFVVVSKNGLPSYQLAVVVDDLKQRVTEVVRGDDLLSSTPRQIWIARALGFSTMPRYWHLPLVIGQDGRRLAKRHGDTRIASYREAGVSAERVLGLLARWSGVIGRDELSDVSIERWLGEFQLDRLALDPVTMTTEMHDRLLDR